MKKIIISKGILGIAKKETINEFELILIFLRLTEANQVRFLVNLLANIDLFSSRTHFVLTFR